MREELGHKQPIPGRLERGVVSRWRAAFGLGVFSWSWVLSSVADDDVVDIDLWHAECFRGDGARTRAGRAARVVGAVSRAIGVAVGPPNWYAAQGNVFLSFSNGKTFSIFGGYGTGVGAAGGRTDHHRWLGWRTVHSRGFGTARVSRQVPALSALGRRGSRHPSRSLRRHHSGVGLCSLSFEMGAASSEQNHWLITLEVSLKFPCRCTFR